MKTQRKIYYTAADLAEMLGISLSQGYRIIARMNQELAKSNYLIIRGKVPVRYFEKLWYGMETVGAR